MNNLFLRRKSTNPPLGEVKIKVFRWLSISEKPGDVSWYFDSILTGLIILNVLAIILESIPSIGKLYQQEFLYFEVFSVMVFTIEYLLRLWSINVKREYHKPFTGNLNYAFTPMAVVDLLAVLPFYLPFLGVDLRLIRMLRLFRLFRIFKITRYVKALYLVQEVFQNKKEELTISLIFTFFLLLITSSMMYFIENEVQPENFSSIPETMWWGIATLTTVGYGDVYPITGMGKFLGGLIAVLGVGLFALPAGIIASGFSEGISTNKKIDPCPCCGKVH